MKNHKPAKAKLPVLAQVCKLIPTHLTDKLATKYGIDKQENGVRENGVRVQILTKCLSNLRFPSITDKSLHFGRQLGLRLPPIEPAELLAHVRCAAHR